MTASLLGTFQSILEIFSISVVWTVLVLWIQSFSQLFRDCFSLDSIFFPAFSELFLF